MFGGNDQKTDSLRHTDPLTSYKQNMASYVKETRTLGHTYFVHFTCKKEV